MKYISFALCVFSVLLCAGCMDITHLQTGYVDNRDACRARAENNVRSYAQPDSYPMNAREKNNALLFLFCECMKEHDWNVVGCKEAKPPATTAVAAAAPPPAAFPAPPMAVPVPNASPSAGGLEPNAKDRVFFAYNSTVISPEDQYTLQRQAQWLRLHPDVNVILEGHCDDRGTREYNLALGDRRAHAVKEYLTSLGIAPSRMETISYGKERPEAIGADEAAWSRNRRSVTVLPKPL